MTTREQLLERIPDKPVWVETRCALLEGGDVFGEPDNAVVRSLDKEMLFLLGRPSDQIFEAALDEAGDTVEVVAQVEDVQHGEYLMGLPGAEARIYTAGSSPPRLPAPGVHDTIEELTRADLPRLSHLPLDLREELEGTLEDGTRVSAAITDGLPVSFCYPSALTEGQWDVSIDTWEPYRRRGFAAAAFGGMYERMLQAGKSVVWGAMEWNEASWRLADKLGLVQAGTVCVWTAHALNLR